MNIKLAPSNSNPRKRTTLKNVIQPKAKVFNFRAYYKKMYVDDDPKPLKVLPIYLHSPYLNKDLLGGSNHFSQNTANIKRRSNFLTGNVHSRQSSMNFGSSLN